MKIDKKLLQYCLYSTVTVFLIYIGIAILNNIGDILSLLFRTLGKIIGVLRPLLTALVIVYLLKPCVNIVQNFLEKKEIFKKQSSRKLAGILVVYALILVGFIATIVGIYIMIGGKFSKNMNIANMTLHITDYLKNSASSVNSNVDKLEQSNISILGGLKDKINQITDYVRSYFFTSIGVMVNSIVSIGSYIASFIIAIVLSIYIIHDSNYFMNLWNKTFNLIFSKSKAGVRFKEILCIIDDTTHNYIRGQLLEACFVGVLSATILYFIGIDYALIIGVISGICNMIPFIGPLVGTFLAVIAALTTGQPISAVWAIIGMLVVQQVDNNLLAPKVIGNSVGLHPVFIMMAIIIGGDVGGLIGMLVAVPVFASIKIVLSKWYTSHMERSTTL